MLDAPLDTALGTSPASAPRDWRDRPAFVSTHRAQGISSREVQWISDEIARRLRARHAAGELPALVVAQSPGRCMVQLGPVALTVAWLRGQMDAVADGQLMVAVWEGAVVHGTRRIPERAPVPRAATARIVHEETFTVVAQDEASWRWHVADDVGGLTSMSLVDRCLDRLLAEHARHDAAGVA